MIKGAYKKCISNILNDEYFGSFLPEIIGEIRVSIISTSLQCCTGDPSSHNKATK